MVDDILSLIYFLICSADFVLYFLWIRHHYGGLFFSFPFLSFRFFSGCHIFGCDAKQVLLIFTNLKFAKGLNMVRTIIIEILCPDVEVAIGTFQFLFSCHKYKHGC